MAKSKQIEILDLVQIDEQFVVFDMIPDSARVLMFMNLIENFIDQKEEFLKMV